MKSRSIFSSLFEKTRKLNFKQQISIFGMVLILTIAIPIVFFIGYFKDQQISTDVANWGALGSYVGGVIGVILALTK